MINNKTYQSLWHSMSAKDENRPFWLGDLDPLAVASASQLAGCQLNQTHCQMAQRMCLWPGADRSQKVKAG